MRRAARGVSAETTAQAPANFAEVRSGLYRGAHPSLENLQYLKDLGVTTIVDLEIADYIEATPAEIQQELDDAASLGLTVVREPMSAFEPFVNDEQMDDTLAVLASTLADDGLDGDDGGDWLPGDDDADADASPGSALDGGVPVIVAPDAGSIDDVDAGPPPASGAVYVHCRHGEDRTGLVVGLERVLVEGWQPSDAYAEMLSFGFHPEFLGLRYYFFEKTGDVAAE